MILVIYDLGIWAPAPNCGSFFEDRGKGYVLWVPSDFHLTLAAGITVMCAQAVRRLCKDRRRWQATAGSLRREGFQGQRWYAWVPGHLPMALPADPSPPNDR